jgi:hypothetical protein
MSIDQMANRTNAVLRKRSRETLNGPWFCEDGLLDGAKGWNPYLVA